MTETAPTNAAPASPISHAALIARELSLPIAGVAAVVELLAEGNTVPFIARYRKERTGDLDEVQIRTIDERRVYLGELEERRGVVLASIAEQGKLTPELEARIRGCDSKAELEDLYLPFKPKRRTRATIAREKGLEPLALRILAQPVGADVGVALAEAAAFINKELSVLSAQEALAGAQDIVAEVIAEQAAVRATVRQAFLDEGVVVSEGVAAAKAEPTKFEQYYDFRESVRTIPSHRFLAIRRGEAEGVLRAHVEVDADRLIAGILRLMEHRAASPFGEALVEAAADGYKRLIAPSVENDVRVELKLRSDVAAVEVFADNLKNLLLAGPLGTRPVVGVDPGLRTGCKCAAVDETGKFLGTITIFLSQGEGALERSRVELAAFLREHRPAAIAVGNGTGGREAEAFVRKLVSAEGGADAPFVVPVSEAGASVYSASDVAREEFPELDLTIRGAISIARRLQDPLAELVKIDPKAIGVGQYQHDVHQPLLQKKLGDVVESCVNSVGVELNTASASLLGYVAGVGKSLAKKIVSHREKHGAFAARAQLLEVSGLGPKAFEQAAGFLRIRGGAQPLDGSGVHPERYGLVERMASELGVEVAQLVGDESLVARIDPARYAGDGVGELTLRDILGELVKPGRDPRAGFEPPRFRDDVQTMADLAQGMTLEGVVTNVTAFGAFVDIGVHQDGLVHVSQLSDRFVKDPKDVVKVGDKLKVRVLDVDLARKRIALSAKSEVAAGVPGASGGAERRRPDGGSAEAQQGERRGSGRRDDRPSRGQGQGRSQAQGQGQRQGQGQGGRARRGEAASGAVQMVQPPHGAPSTRDQPRAAGRDDRPRPSEAAPRRDDRPRTGDGPRREPRRDDRVRGDAPPADQRGDKKDWGVAGFTNNPFARLSDLDKK